jgi:hypothetical protein
MRYFDGYFKTAQDGSKLFFPWGALGRGYVIASEQDYKRLQRLVKVYTMVSLLLMVGAVALQGYVGCLVISALLIVFYMVWTRYLLRGLRPSDERLSLQDSMTTQGLWLREIGALAFVGFGILIIVFDPGNWLIALASIVFFGLCAAVFTRRLVLRWRAATTQP